jgi:hypothetical protein
MPALELAGAVVVAGVAWRGGWFFPIKRCRRCQSRKGRGSGSSRFGYSRCRKCGGSGEQVRWTAQLIRKATGTPVRGVKG